MYIQAILSVIPAAASGHKSWRANAGFTLMEVVVAVVVFSFVTVLCFNALTFILDYDERDKSFYENQNRLQRTWNIVLQDMLHLRARTERDRLGGVKRAYQTNTDQYLVVFIRGGFPSITGTESGLQRVAYSVNREGQFLRWTWPGVDRYDDEEPNSQVLMSGVESAEFWQLNLVNEYEKAWPPLNQQLPNDALPRMIRLVINLDDGNRIERIIPGLETPTNIASNSGGNGDEDGEDGS